MEGHCTDCALQQPRIIRGKDRMRQEEKEKVKGTFGEVKWQKKFFSVTETKVGIIGTRKV